MKTDAPSYHGYRFPAEIISHAVWLYHRVPQSGNGRTQDASNHCPTSYRKDDGRPVEVGYQEQASNHLKRLSLRAAVVSVEETLSKTRQVWIRKTNVSKPLLTRREPEHDIETGGGWYLRDKSGGCPECRPGGVPACRWRESDSGFSMELREPVVLMQREPFKWRTPQEPEYRCKTLGRSRPY